MLPRNYRFRALNGCGQTIVQNAITVKCRRWRFAADGAVVWESSESTVYIMDEGAGLATAGNDAGTAVDNSTDLWIGGDFEFEVTTPASAAGDVSVYLERSSDAGSSFDTLDGNSAIISRLCAVITCGASTTYRKTFSL